MNGCNNHSPDPLYTNVNSHNVPTAPQTGGVTVADGGTLQFRPQIRKTHLISLILQIPLSLTFDYSVGVTITLGADLGLDLGAVVKAGIGASVGTTTTAGENQGGTAPCPARLCECALQIISQGTQVDGTITEYDYSTCSFGPGKPYTVIFPQTVNGVNTNANISACAYRNVAHWADDGAPPPCPDDCTA